MTNPQFSVIVPVYNSEKTLRRCVDSILAQTCQDFELILVDDGSTDGSPAICDEFAKEHPNIIAVHQPNGGPNSARNKGLEIAGGEFVVFVDADDEFYTDDTLEKNIEYILRDDELDIVSFPQYIEYRDESDKCCIRIKETQFQTLRLVDKRQMFLNWYNGVLIDGGFPGKIFRKSIFNGWKLTESIRFTEDIYSVPDQCERCRAAMITGVGGYLYKYNPDSAIHTEYTNDKRYGEFKTQAHVCRYLLKFTDVKETQNKFFFQALENAYYLYDSKYRREVIAELSDLKKGDYNGTTKSFLKILYVVTSIFGYNQGIRLIKFLLHS